MSNQIKQADVDWPTVLKLMGGGAALGGGIGSGAMLMRYLTALNEKSKKNTGTSKDDDILYLNLPAKSAAVKSADGDRGTASTFAVGGLGAILGSYLGYNAVRNIYSKLRKQQLQKELDESQQAYMTGLGNARQLKSAAAKGQFSGVSKLVGSGYLAGLLTVLGSAVLANQILKKQFPVNSQTRPKQPRKIVLRSQGRPGIMKEDSKGMEKEIPVDSASANPEGIENLVRLNLANQKAASWGLSDLVAAVANGEVEQVRENIQAVGLDSALDLIKGASAKSIVGLNENLAISLISHDPLISNAIQPYLAAQLVEDSPTFAKAASVLSEELSAEELADLIGVGEAAALDARTAAYAPITERVGMEKIAAAKGKPMPFTGLTRDLLVVDALSRLLDNKGQGQEAPPVTEEEPTNNVAESHDSDEALGQQRKAKKPSYAVADEQADQFLNQHQDLIDDALASVG